MRGCSTVLFSSITFLFYFLPIVIAVYFLIPKRILWARNLALLAASLIFYSWGEPVYVFLMIYSACFNWFMAREIERTKDRGGSGRTDLLFTIAVDLSILCFFKYFSFLMDNINALTGMNISYTALALPIGISFYTFQAMSYIFDVYRRKVRAQRSLFKFALYLSFFPQLIAGPIVKYRDIENQLRSRETDLDSFGDGVSRFITGLGKKVLLANNLGALQAAVLALPDNNVSAASYWIGAFAFTMQIYFDFSGYSDMAIGLGRMFGFRFSENFDHPYVAESITEFWRKWHISLSSWFREYLYFPLGGNRVPPARHILNLVIVWALTGLWHGANWTFVVWGLYYCVVLILEKYVYGKWLKKLPAAAAHIYTMLIVSVGWVIFMSDSIKAALAYLKTCFMLSGCPLFDASTLFFLRTSIVLMLVSVLCSTKRPGKALKRLREKTPALWLAILFAIFVLSTAYLLYSTYNPFLYFRF